MARRATSLTKGLTSTQEPEPAETEQTAKASGRGKRAKAQAAEDTGADNTVNGGEEIVEVVADRGSADPTRARRTRKSRLIELAAETLNPDSGEPQETDAPMAEVNPVDHGDMPEGPAEDAAVPEPSPVSTDQTPAAAEAQASAAHWDTATGTATFDWSAIEHVAASEGPNQAMARLLLAARAEGANSRWPF